MTSERNPERDLMNQKKKNEKSGPFETKFLTNHAMEEMCNPYCQGLSVSRSRGKTYIRK